MAEIQIVYREYYCAADYPKFCTQCYTQFAKDLGCPCYDDGTSFEKYIIRKDGTREIPFGDCFRSRVRHIYKGLSAKNYEIEPFEDTYNPFFNCMHVKIGKKEYECDRVILNGDCIYNNLTD